MCGVLVLIPLSLRLVSCKGLETHNGMVYSLPFGGGGGGG